jgi:hypothetical protein
MDTQARRTLAIRASQSIAHGYGIPSGVPKILAANLWPSDEIIQESNESVPRGSALTTLNGPAGTVNAGRPGRIYPAKARCRENSWLITGWKVCYRQESPRAPQHELPNVLGGPAETLCAHFRLSLEL